MNEEKKKKKKTKADILEECRERNRLLRLEVWTLKQENKLMTLELSEFLEDIIMDE